MKATYTPPTGSAYQHDDQDVRIVEYSSKHAYADDQAGGRYLGLTKSITIEWEIRSTTQTLLAAKMALAEAAYEVGDDGYGASLIVKHDNGDASRHTMPATAGAGGVGTRVLDFGYRENSGVEYATVRTAYAMLTHGAIIDLANGSPNSPSSPGADFDSGTALPAYDWANDRYGDGSYPESGGAEFDYFETYEVEGGDIVDVVETLPTGSSVYIWRKTERDVRIETHTINIVSTIRPVAFPSTVIGSGGAEIRRKVGYGRRSGNPPRYQTTVTYSKRS